MLDRSHCSAWLTLAFESRERDCECGLQQRETNDRRIRSFGNVGGERYRLILAGEADPNSRSALQNVTTGRGLELGSRRQFPMQLQSIARRFRLELLGHSEWNAMASARECRLRCE